MKRLPLPFFLMAGSFSLALAGGPAESENWQSDAPGMRHQYSAATLAAPYATASVKNTPKVVPAPAGAQLQVPDGFEVKLYAKDIPNPRHLVTAPNGDIFVSESMPGKIVILRDADGDGVPEIRSEFATGLNMPFGAAFYPSGSNPQYLYVGDTNGVVRLPYHNGDLKASGPAEPIASLSAGGHLTGGGHWTRDVVFSLDDKKLFASVGSVTNDEEKPDPREEQRARIFCFNADGSDREVYATGIRNAVGLAVNPTTGVLWASVNERDGLGDDLVPDYITQIKADGFYGWPWYYMGAHPDPRHPEAPKELAAQVIVPDVLVQSHSATLNMLFYEGSQFPADYQGDAFAAFHGSWNRSPRTGYKVIRVPLNHGQPKGYYEDFLTGFVVSDASVWGRPVGLTVMKDGSLLVSEDGNNTIWRISHKK